MKARREEPVRCDAAGCTCSTLYGSRDWLDEWVRVYVEQSCRSYEACCIEHADQINRERGSLRDARQLRLPQMWAWSERLQSDD